MDLEELNESHAQVGTTVLELRGQRAMRQYLLWFQPFLKCVLPTF